MRKILVLGGTKFFGKRLVHKLLNNGDEVAVATRGETPHPFGERVHHIKVDRFDRGSMEKAFQDGEWDVIYDQICFSPDDALDACEIFEGRTDRYVLTSTLSVYEFNEKPEKNETDFDPYSHEWRSGRKEQFDYGEGKRQAEAVFFQKAKFPVAAPRPPVVFGPDDYTERLHYHARKVLAGQRIGLDHPEAAVSFVDSDDLAEFLYWTGFQEFTGPVNSSSPDQITLGKMIELIETASEKKAVIEPTSSGAESSPLNFPVSAYQDVSLAEANGYSFKPLSEWFEPLVRQIVKEESTN
ncbi:NAD-dependent epimerase/dehydratase family protein [Salipaludibacillus aurantiacus]|uniref:Nucleoside-diphosphate-sugar epimerase n=1 Tax=Salipaludibacillus aurantiacus TaxID=1601833 RepID=A0A1H9RQZ1_9BACI|nr:NAD-dependent epimerase/dehydratase family protein [Salipaludibacillus aurantiacus]SER74948.1 Nucleoside-diphosphate-sugar epimerase [Salipaludibacillus aurantiacus]